jgi:hypothetical protein
MIQTNTVTNIPTNLNAVSPGFQARIEARDSVDPEVLRLKARNALWEKYAPEWDFFLSAYEGGRDFVNETNISQYTMRENPDDFKARVKRAHYLNYCGELVDFFTNFIFSETIQRDGGTNSSWYQTFIRDVNKKGESIEEYMKQVEDALQIYGMVYTLVDSPQFNLSDSIEVVTQQQTDDLGIRPYWVIMSPLEIVDWMVDDFENFQYVKRLQMTTRMIDDSIHPVEKYTEWFSDHTICSYVDVSDTRNPKLLENLRERFENPLGSIPIAVQRHKRSKRFPFIGISFLQDLAYNNREIMNYTSLIQEFLYKQCFNILAKESDTALPLRDQNDGVLGTANVLEYPKGTTAPQYITPPVDPAEFLQSERSRITGEMFKLAAQDTMNELFNGEKSSGFSQAQSFSKTVPFISTRADTLEKYENKLMSLTMQRLSKNWDGKVKYKDRYELTNLTDAMTQLVSLFRDLQFPSETFIKEELKRLAEEYDGKLPQAISAKVMKEIDDMDFTDWQATQVQALVGTGGGNSPASQQKPKSTGTLAEAASEAKVNTGATKKLKPAKNK